MEFKTIKIERQTFWELMLFLTLEGKIMYHILLKLLNILSGSGTGAGPGAGVGTGVGTGTRIETFQSQNQNRNKSLWFHNTAYLCTKEKIETN